jgi:hypothetical protein
MHQEIYQELETICAAANISGAVLEVGAIPSDISLLAMQPPRIIGFGTKGRKL